MSKKTDENSKTGLLRWLKWSVVLLLLVGGLAAGAYWWSQRVVLAEEQIRNALRVAGLVDFDLALTDVGLRSARVESFVVGDMSHPTLRVQDIRVAYTLSGLLEQRLQSIEIGDVSVALKADESGLDLGPLGPLMGGTDGGGGFETGPVSVETFSATLDLPQGTINLGGGGVIHQAGAGYRLVPSGGCVDVAAGDLRFGGIVLDSFSTQVCVTSVDGDVYWPPTSGLAFRTAAIPLTVRNDLGYTMLDAQFARLHRSASC